MSSLPHPQNIGKVGCRGQKEDIHPMLVGLTVWSVSGGSTIVFSIVFMTSFQSSFSTRFRTVFSQILANRVKLRWKKVNATKKRMSILRLTARMDKFGLKYHMACSERGDQENAYLCACIHMNKDSPSIFSVLEIPRQLRLLGRELKPPVSPSLLI